MTTSLYFDDDDDGGGAAIDVYSCDEFLMYEFKVRRCPRDDDQYSHDWYKCPYLHLGEKARRRDPRKCHYWAKACPDFRKGRCCRKGDACEMAHGVFECWLHPAKYRTQPCREGTACRRRVCFFAHTPDQLRLVFPPPPQSPRMAVESDSYDGSPMRQRRMMVVFEVVAAMRKLQLGIGREMETTGRELRATMYERLMISGHGPGQGPDVGWVSELVK